METPTNSLKVFDIQRSCVDDGPGVRTTIFFQGCNLRCDWCQNPEGLSLQGGPSDRDYSIDEIMDVVLRDKEYYFSTDSGVTLSGGEPLLQDADNLINLLETLEEENIKVAVETSLHVPWEKIEKVAPYIDLFLVDLKVVGDENLHKEYTNQDPSLIQDNIDKLLNLDADVKFRMVMVPGYNDDEENIRATSEFLKSIGYDSIELLKYHNLYEDKAERLDLEYEPLNISLEEGKESLKKGLELFEKHGINAESSDLESPRLDPDFSDRVEKIRRDIRDAKPGICIEDAKLRTEYYKEHGFKEPLEEGEFKKPAHIHRGECLSYVLENKEIEIYPQELLVGNFTSYRVGARTWLEYVGMIAAGMLYNADKGPNKYQAPTKDLITFATEIGPYWLHHSTTGKIWPEKEDLMEFVSRTLEWKRGMNFNILGVGHYIPNYERILNLGTTGLKERLREKKEENPESCEDFYNGALISLDGLEVFAERYANHLKDLSEEEEDPERREELEKMAEICEHVPKNPARTFHEALQSMLFLHIALCHETNENAISFGRLDQILYPYYKKDKEEGRITYDEAKELLSLFVLKMDELILGDNGDDFPPINKLFQTKSTDQAITFGGMDKDGNDATNEVTHMLIEICKLQPLAADPAARVHEDSPQEYMEKLTEIYTKGCPLPQLFNDEVYIESLLKHYDTTREKARDYAIVGCVEPVASDDHFGNTDCANMNLSLPLHQAMKGQEHDLWEKNPHLGMAELGTETINHMISDHLFREKVDLENFFKFIPNKIREEREKRKGIHDYDPPESMDELLERFQERLNEFADSVLSEHQRMEKVHRENYPTPLASALYEGCVESGKSIMEGGTTHNSAGIQAIGVTDVADSLHAIKEVVFEKELYTIEEVIEAVDSNFEGEKTQEIKEALEKVPKFGDDSSKEASEWMNTVLEIYNNALDSVDNCPRGGRYSAGYYALNLSNEYGRHSPALPSGREAETPFANSLTPHYGMEQSNIFSPLNSLTELDFAEHAENGTTATLTIDSALFSGQEGNKNLANIIRTFFAKGGMQLQPNVVNREMLLDAYENPEKYPDLMVRIAGYCERFNSLTDEMKLHIINRPQYS